MEALDTLLQSVSPYLETFWSYFNDYAYLRAALIAALAYMLAKILAHLIPRALQSAFRKLRFQLGDELAELLRFPLFSITFVSGLALAAQSSGLEEPVAGVVKAALKSLLIIILAVSLYRIIRHLLHHTAESRERLKLIQPQTLPLFTNTVMIFISVAAIHQVFAAWNVDMTALLASAGIAGLAIGMASKDMLTDIISGVLIMSDTPYRVGDVVVLETIRGKVQQIGLRSTRILTKNNVEIVIPNSMMSNSKIINESSSEQEGLRIMIEIQTAFGIDPQRVRTLMQEVCHHNANVMTEPEPKVHLIGFTERHAQFRLLFWILDPYQQGPIAASVREGIYACLMDEQIKMAEPHRSAVVIDDHKLQPQELLIKEMPDNERTLSIKEIPDLFGSGQPKKLSRIGRGRAVLTEQDAQGATE